MEAFSLIPFEKKDRILFISASFYAVFLGLEISRALISECYGFEGCYLLVVLSAFFFLAISLCPPYFAPKAPRCPYPEHLLCYFLFFLCGTVFSYFSENLAVLVRGRPLVLAFLIPLLATFPFFFYGLACRNVLLLPRRDDAYKVSFLACAGGALGALVFYLLLRFLRLHMEIVLALLGGGLLCWPAFLLRKDLTRSWRRILLIFLVLGEVLIAYLFIFSPQGRSLHHSPCGVITMHGKKGDPCATVLKKNNQDLASFPHMAELDIPPVLIASLQPNRETISVLLAASELSPVARAFLNLRMVEELDFLSSDSKLVKFASAPPLCILPRPDEDERFHVLYADPRAYMESAQKTYDLIFIERPLPYSLSENRFYTYEFFCAAARLLKNGGAFALALPELKGYSENTVSEFCGSLTLSLRRVFRHVEFTNKNGVRLVIAGNTPSITRDMLLLDARTFSFQGFDPFLPEGLLAALYPDVIQDQDSERIAGAAVSAAPNLDFSPELPVLLWQRHPALRAGKIGAGGGVSVYGEDSSEDGKDGEERSEEGGIAWRIAGAANFIRLHSALIFLPLLALYLLFRYFVSWKAVHKKSFILYENGLFSGGVLCFVFALQEGRMGNGYLLFPLGTGLFLLSAAGVYLLKEKKSAVSSVLKWFSCFLPVLAVLAGQCPAWGVQLLFFPMLMLCGASGGLIHHAMLNDSNTPEENTLLFSAEFLGLLSGMLLFSCFAFSTAGALAACVIFLSAVRLIRVAWDQGT